MSAVKMCHSIQFMAVPDFTVRELCRLSRSWGEIKDYRVIMNKVQIKISNNAHRCYNKELRQGNSGGNSRILSYIVGQGEDRWDCHPTERDANELKSHGLELHRAYVKCTDVSSGACEASYILREIQHVEPMDWMRSHNPRPKYRILWLLSSCGRQWSGRNINFGDSILYKIS